MASEIFPKTISAESNGGAAFDVDIVGNAREWRNLATRMPRWEFDVSHAAQTPDRYVPLQAFFIAHQGPLLTFRYWDPLDHVVAAGDGAFETIDATHFQMRKLYQFGALTFYRSITKPISGTITITGGSGASVDYETGIVTVASGTPTAWVGQFHVNARFNARAMVPRVLAPWQGKGYIVQWEPIPVVEVRVLDEAIVEP